MTEIVQYAGPQVEQYRAGLAMTPEDAKALDEQIRACTRAVLREGTDYGTIPGTSDSKVLFKPGAEKLLQWFGLGFTIDRQDVEYGDGGRKEGVTYRAVITKRLPDGTVVSVATCEGYAGYDEAKFYQSAEDAQYKAESRERMWAARDKRPANPNKWKHITEGYRAPWNTILKMAQKRALVGATIDAAAAAGLFTQEEDDSPPADDGTTWYEQALAEAITFAAVEDGQRMLVEASHAARDGLCTPGQATHVKNRIKQRLQLLQTATPVNVEDVGQQAAQDDAAEDGDDRHRKLVGAVQGHMKRLKFTVDDSDREPRLVILTKLAGVPGSDGFDSTGDFNEDELKTIADALAECRNRAALDKLLAAGETGE